MTGIYRMIRYGLMLVAVAVMTACGKGDEPDPVKPPSRTVLVYMIADNSLGSSSFGVDADNLAQMDKAVAAGALGETGRLLVYHDGATATPELLEITAEGRRTLTAYSESESSVSESRMRQVINDMKSEAPADGYGLVLWSHGTGWIESSTSRSGTPGAVTQSFGQDLHPTSTEMKVTTLASVLNGEGFEFIYFDCCFMATVEVAYELRDATPWIIASATELPVEGMPYTVNIHAMFAEELDLEQIAANTLDYYKSPEASYNSCTISLISTAALPELAAATRAIMLTGAIPEIYYRAMPFFRSGGVNSHTYDMGHYISALPVSAQLLSAWESAYKKAVPYYGATPYSYGLDMTDFTGLGCYIVKTSDDASLLGYRNQSWWKDVVSQNPSLN